MSREIFKINEGYLPNLIFGDYLILYNILDVN